MIEWKIKKKKIVKILIIKDWRKVGGIPNKDKREDITGNNRESNEKRVFPPRG